MSKIMSPGEFFVNLIEVKQNAESTSTETQVKEAVLKVFDENIPFLLNHGGEEVIKRFEGRPHGMDEFKCVAIYTYQQLYDEGLLEKAHPQEDIKIILGWLMEYRSKMTEMFEKDEFILTCKKMAKRVISCQSKEEALFEFESVISKMYDAPSTEENREKLEKVKKDGLTLTVFLLRAAVAIQDLFQHYAATKELPEEDCKRAFYYFYGYNPDARKSVYGAN